MSKYGSFRYRGVSISNGNNQVGFTPNLSLDPNDTCGPDAPCWKRCFARKCTRHTTVKNAWHGNYLKAMTDPVEFWSVVDHYIGKHKPEYFRFHIGGDIPDQPYLDQLFRLVADNPDVRFMAYTKRHDLDYRNKPENLCILFSMWPNWGDPAAVSGPRAWVDDGNEPRIPENAHKCTADSCEDCRFCWHADRLERDVVFDLR